MGERRRRQVAIFEFSTSLHSSVAAALLTFLLHIGLPSAEGHIASLIGNGGQKQVDIGKHFVFCDLGHLGEGKPPHLSHIRVSRGPTVSPSEEESEEAAARLNFLKSPSYQHKYLHRLSQFHSNNPGSRVNYGGGSGFASNDIGTQADISSDSTEEDAADLNPIQGTFTPYISARALSNIPKFFEHLRENLEALQQEEDYNNSEDRDIGQPDRRRDPSGESLEGEEIDYFPERLLAQRLRWQPPASGLINHRHNTRSFMQPPSEEETYLRRANNYNPSWLYTNLGLGKRRRR